MKSNKNNSKEWIQLKEELKSEMEAHKSKESEF